MTIRMSFRPLRTLRFLLDSEAPGPYSLSSAISDFYGGGEWFTPAGRRAS